MIVFETFEQFKEMITQLVVSWTMIVSKTIVRWIAIDLSKQQTLDTDTKIQQINFTGNLDEGAGATMFFLIEEARETVLEFS